MADAGFPRVWYVVWILVFGSMAICRFGAQTGAHLWTHPIRHTTQERRIDISEPPPLAEHFLERYFTKHPMFGDKGYNFSRAHESFRNEFSTLCIGSDFPKSVVYPSWCGALCVSATPPPILQLQRQFKEALSRNG